MLILNTRVGAVPDFRSMVLRNPDDYMASELLANLRASTEHNPVSTVALNEQTAAQCTQSSERSGQQEAAKTWVGVGVEGCLAEIWFGFASSAAGSFPRVRTMPG